MIASYLETRNIAGEVNDTVKIGDRPLPVGRDMPRGRLRIPLRGQAIREKARGGNCARSTPRNSPSADGGITRPLNLGAGKMRNTPWVTHVANEVGMRSSREPLATKMAVRRDKLRPGSPDPPCSARLRGAAYHRPDTEGSGGGERRRRL